MTSKGLLSAVTLCKTNESNTAFVRLLNVGNEPIMIHQNERMGFIEEVAKEDILEGS